MSQDMPAFSIPISEAQCQRLCQRRGALGTCRFLAFVDSSPVCVRQHNEESDGPLQDEKGRVGLFLCSGYPNFVSSDDPMS
jgi:hypothetical protein